LHDRNPIYVKLSDGGLRNGYTIKLLNKLYQPRSFSIGVTGLPGASLSVIGHEQETNPAVTVPPDELQSLRLYVTLDKAAVAPLSESAVEFAFVVTDLSGRLAVEHKATFQGPER
jgi:polyferredoxin